MTVRTIASTSLCLLATMLAAEDAAAPVNAEPAEEATPAEQSALDPAATAMPEEATAPGVAADDEAAAAGPAEPPPIQARLLATEALDPTTGEADGEQQFDREQAVAWALAHAREAVAAEHELEAARSQAASRLAFARPQAEALASVYFVKDNRNQLAKLYAPDEKNELYRGAVGVRQFLYGFGSRSAAKQRGRGDIAQADANKQLTDRELAYQTRFAVGSVWHARQRVAIARARLELRTKEHQDASQLYQAGRIASIDVRQAEVSRIQAADGLSVERVNLATVTDDLALLLNLPPDAFTVSGELQRVPDFAELEAAIAEAVEQGNTETAVVDSVILSQEGVIRALSAADLPQFFVAGDYNLTTGELDDIDEQTSGWGVGLEAVWTFDGGGRINQRAQARSQMAAFAERRQLSLDRIRTEFEKLQTSRESFAARITEQTEAVRLAEQNYTDTVELYRAGRVTLTRITEANLSLVEARFRLADLIFAENIVAYRMRRLAE
jgi:outer membrane protein TolC